MMENKKIVYIFLSILTIGAFAGIISYSNAKITTFEECENSWLVRSIVVYDYVDANHSGPDKKCTLWTGKSFEK